MRSVSDLPPSLERLRDRLAARSADAASGGTVRFLAAVAVVLRDGAHGLEVLLIQRTIRPGDPWSGHMSFPGGRVEVDDGGPLGAAVRETREEIGVDLERQAVLLGRLADIVPRGRGRRLGVVAVPHVFALTGAPPMDLSPDEVEEVVWLPLAFLRDDANRTRMWWWRGLLPVRLPCYRFRGHLVWGMTLRALDELVVLTDPQGPDLPNDRAGARHPV